jgi:CheY-like chemotaxis protein
VGDPALADIDGQDDELVPSQAGDDIGIPERDGYDFIREVRRKGIDSPAIALTAYARYEDRLRILGAGYQMHLSKPVDSEELPVVVASVVGRQSL